MMILLLLLEFVDVAVDVAGSFVPLLFFIYYFRPSLSYSLHTIIKRKGEKKGICETDALGAVEQFITQKTACCWAHIPKTS